MYNNPKSIIWEFLMNQTNYANPRRRVIIITAIAGILLLGLIIILVATIAGGTKRRASTDQTTVATTTTETRSATDTKVEPVDNSNQSATSSKPAETATAVKNETKTEVKTETSTSNLPTTGPEDSLLPLGAILISLAIYLNSAKTARRNLA